MSFKVGDKVRIITFLKEGNHYHEYEFVVRSMLKYAGIVTEVIKVREDGLYDLSCDDGSWYWPEKTLKPYTKSNYDKIHNMTDEQLARFLIGFKNTFGEEYEGEMSCLDWLRRDVDE